MNPDVVRGIVFWLVFFIAFCFLNVLFFNQYLPAPFVVWIFLSLNLATFFLTALDKCFASWHKRRIPESVFYLSTLTGGSIGMLVGMNIFRHKTKKLSFQMVIGVLILIQVAMLIWLMGL